GSLHSAQHVEQVTVFEHGAVGTDRGARSTIERMGVPKAKSMSEFMHNRMQGGSAAIDPALRRISAHIGRACKPAGVVLRKGIDVSCVARQVHARSFSGILRIDGNLREIAGRDAVWDCEPANDSRRNVGLTV